MLPKKTGFLRKPKSRKTGKEFLRGVTDSNIPLFTTETRRGTEKILEFLCDLCASVVKGDFKSDSLPYRP
jgi:hypothetical protein